MLQSIESDQFPTTHFGESPQQHGVGAEAGKFFRLGIEGTGNLSTPKFFAGAVENFGFDLRSVPTNFS